MLGPMATDNGPAPVAPEIDDGGRRRFDSFEAALEVYQAPLANRPRMREIAAELTFSEIWIPASGSYIAVSPGPDERIVAYFNRGFVEVRDDDGNLQAEIFPENWIRDGGGSATSRLDAADRGVCAACSIQLPATGACGTCEG